MYKVLISLLFLHVSFSSWAVLPPKSQEDLDNAPAIFCAKVAKFKIKAKQTKDAGVNKIKMKAKLEITKAIKAPEKWQDLIKAGNHIKLKGKQKSGKNFVGPGTPINRLTQNDLGSTVLIYASINPAGKVKPLAPNGIQVGANADASCAQ